MTVVAGSRAIVRAAVAPINAEPAVSSPQVSQRLAGHFVDVLDRSGDWLRVRGADGYSGWMHAGYLAPAPRGVKPGEPMPRVSLGCAVQRPDGRRRALPLGAYLEAGEALMSGEAITAEEREKRFPAAARAIAASAAGLFQGAPYAWGGITPWGADCSGFVQSLFGLHDVALPRDASQQAEHGVATTRGLANIEAAELAFFSDRDDRRITHVGIGLGGGRLAHVAIGRGGHATENLTDSGDSYVAALRERFLFARRIL